MCALAVTGRVQSSLSPTLCVELTYIIIDEKHVHVKHVGNYIFIKSVCPIYVYDTWEYVGSAFWFIMKIMYVISLKCEEKPAKLSPVVLFFKCLL